MNESHPSNKKKTAQTQPGGNLDEAFKKEPTIKDDLVLSGAAIIEDYVKSCLLYTSPSPRDQRGSRMPSSA